RRRLGALHVARIHVDRQPQTRLRLLRGLFDLHARHADMSLDLIPAEAVGVLSLMGRLAAAGADGPLVHQQGSGQLPITSRPRTPVVLGDAEKDSRPRAPFARGLEADYEVVSFVELLREKGAGSSGSSELARKAAVRRDMTCRLPSRFRKVRIWSTVTPSLVRPSANSIRSTLAAIARRVRSSAYSAMAFSCAPVPLPHSALAAL